MRLTFADPMDARAAEPFFRSLIRTAVGELKAVREELEADPVFKERCRDLTHHPAWDKVYGNPSDPATSIVFGEKGSGKTAMRMQMAGRGTQAYHQATIAVIRATEDSEANS